MKLRVEPFGPEYPELNIISPDESFEVDGIIYTPPWMRDYDDVHPSVHPAPMFDLKDELYCDTPELMEAFSF